MYTNITSLIDNPEHSRGILRETPGLWSGTVECESAGPACTYPTYLGKSTGETLGEAPSNVSNLM